MKESDTSASRAGLIEGWVSVRSVLPMLRGFEALGLDRTDLLTNASIDPSKLADPDSRIATLEFWALWMRALAVSGDESLGVRCATGVKIQDYDIIGYLMATAPTLIAALERIQAYHRLLSDAVYFDMEVDGQQVKMRHQLQGGVPVPRPVSDYVAAASVMLFRTLLGEACTVESVGLADQAPKDTSVHDAYFGVPVDFGCAGNTLVLRLDVQEELPGSDPTLHRLLDEHAQSVLARIPTGDTLPQRVRRLVAEALPGEAPDADAIAGRLGMSPRTLRRQLKDQGTGFSAILGDVRHALAIGYLGDPEVSIAEISYLLGFSEPSAFHRAFKSWARETPAEYRRSRQV